MYALSLGKTKSKEKKMQLGKVCEGENDNFCLKTFLQLRYIVGKREND